MIRIPPLAVSAAGIKREKNTTVASTAAKGWAGITTAVCGSARIRIGVGRSWVADAAAEDDPETPDGLKESEESYELSF